MDSTATVYVRNLPYRTSPEELRAWFEEKGLKIAADQTGEDGKTQRAVFIPRDRETNRSRGFAFVTLISAEEAQKAISMLNGQELQGRQIVVMERSPRDDSAPRRDSKVVDFSSRSRRRDTSSMGDEMAA